MRATTVLPACLFGASILFCSGFLSAFALVSKPAPQHLPNLHSPDLWPADVRRVRAAGEGWKQRVAEVERAERRDAADTPATRISLTLIPSEVPAGDDGDSIDTARRQAHETWCRSRYRSYRSADNAYTSYSGARKDCISPTSDLVAAASLDGGEKPGFVAGVSADDRGRAARCRAQYASYRASDNTYQPFSGPRRLCTLEGF
ncbi:BA14K-like protein [Rhizobium sp. PP-CC-3A-592]|nr:BA14K-like protein [Rhizobium sp. PP-CC-3A-592]